MKVEIEFLARNRTKLIEWLEEKKNTFPWIYSEKELEAAHDQDHVFLILTYQGCIIGYVKIGLGQVYIHDFDQAPTFPPKTAFIYDTFVLPEYRGKRLASFALEQVSRYCREKKYSKILCHIERWNVVSVRAFEGAGYEARESIRFIRLAGVPFFLRRGFLPFLNLESYLKSGGGHMNRRSLIGALVVLVLGLLLPVGFRFNRKNGAPLPPAPGNGVASFSPRVLQAYHPDICSWGYAEGDYTESIDYEAVKRMLTAGLVAFTGAADAASAWNKLIQPYSRGDRIVIKPNLNNTTIGYSRAIMTSPQVIRALVESLLEAGYPPEDITIYDVTAYRDQAATSRFVELGVATVFLNPRPGFFDKVAARAHSGPAAPDTKASIHMRKPVVDQSGKSVRCYMPKVLSQARHMINVPVFKAHQFVLQSSALKNHFGTVRFSNRNTHPVILHGPHIDWHIADINANEHIRNKTRLILVDGLLGAGCFSRDEYNRMPTGWHTLPSGKTPSSLYFSQDPVAVESVLADLIMEEQRALGYEPYSHEYLHVAENRGLGCHEHRDEIGSYSRIHFTKITV
jgi:uncharacterized protein (DUF362 family)/GNAT superfamily N-acetyltransferase